MLIEYIIKHCGGLRRNHWNHIDRAFFRFSVTWVNRMRRAAGFFILPSLVRMADIKSRNQSGRRQVAQNKRSRIILDGAPFFVLLIGPPSPFLFALTDKMAAAKEKKMIAIGSRAATPASPSIKCRYENDSFRDGSNFFFPFPPVIAPLGIVRAITANSGWGSKKRRTQ